MLAILFSVHLSTVAKIIAVDMKYNTTHSVTCGINGDGRVTSYINYMYIAQVATGFIIRTNSYTHMREAHSPVHHCKGVHIKLRQQD